MRTIIYSLVALVLLGVGATGGYFYGLTIGQTQAATVRNAFFQDRGITQGGTATGGAATGGAAGGAGAAQGAAQTAGGAGGFGGQGGQGTFGSVRSVSGNTIEVSTAQAVVKVTVNDQTTIQTTVQQPVNLTDLQVGANVVIQGDRDSQGNVTARTVNVVPQGFGGGGQRGAAADGTPGAGGGQRGAGVAAEGTPGAGGARRPGGGGGQGGQGGAPAQGTPAR